MPPPVATRRKMLDGLLGQPSYAAPSIPMTSSTMTIRLWIGDPLGAGVEVDDGTTNYTSHVVPTSVIQYPNSSDGVNKLYTGSPVTYLADGASWGTVDYVTLELTGAELAWVIALPSPVLMDDGIFLKLDLPELVWGSGAVVVGLTDLIRARLLNNFFGDNSTNPTIAPLEWDVALFIGDPYTTGVEVSSPDYQRFTFLNVSSSFSGLGDEYQIFVDVNIEYPLAQVPWGTVTHVAFFHGELGTLMHAAEVDTPIVVAAGYLITFLAGDIAITFGGP
jgi:hypothetical protein